MLGDWTQDLSQDKFADTTFIKAILLISVCKTRCAFVRHKKSLLALLRKTNFLASTAAMECQHSIIRYHSNAEQLCKG